MHLLDTAWATRRSTAIGHAGPPAGSVEAAYGARTKPPSRIMPMLTPLLTLILFAITGVLAGVAQMRAERLCPCCGQSVARSYVRCPHCRCRVG